MKNIRILAGEEALRTIRKEGFNASMVKAVVSAAGGPKWFSIFGLVRYIIHDLLSSVQNEIHLIGSSVGAWQMTAASTSNPGDAIDRLRLAYCHHRYSDKPNTQEISLACRNIITQMLHDERDYILENELRKLHIITSRGRGWLSASKKRYLYPGFALTAAGNLVDCKYLDNTVRRTIFSNTGQSFFDEEKDQLKTDRIRLNESNFLDALQASGSIPFVMEGVDNIAGGTQGTYWDGGITDYHISVPFIWDEGVVLHPHFSPFVLAGWFDKKIPWMRRANPANMSRVILIYPTKNFVDSLPLKRISELKDFQRFRLDQEARMKYWDQISKQSRVLAEEFHEIIESDLMVDVVEPY